MKHSLSSTSSSLFSSDRATALHHFLHTYSEHFLSSLVREATLRHRTTRSGGTPHPPDRAGCQARLGQSHQARKLLSITSANVLLPSPLCKNFFHASGWNFLWCNLWPFHYQCSPLTKGWFHLLYKLWLGWCRCKDPSQPSPLQAE